MKEKKKKHRQDGGAGAGVGQEDPSGKGLQVRAVGSRGGRTPDHTGPRPHPGAWVLS